MRLRRALVPTLLPALVLTATLAQAETVPAMRPMPRPATVVVSTMSQPTAPLIRPQPRPAFAAAAVDPLPEMHPQPRPEAELVPVAMVTGNARKPAKASMQGSLCNRADIKGKLLQPIVSRIKGCNVPDAVQVSEIAGVALSPPATINCEEAVALSDWITHGLQPAFDHSVARLEVADSYACRPRNNVPGKPVSVHGQGQAIDIAAFVTTSGRTLSVARDYNAAMRKAQKAGCGTFHTILGPGSDGYHETHIHFDVAQHGGRDYCR